MTTYAITEDELDDLIAHACNEDGEIDLSKRRKLSEIVISVRSHPLPATAAPHTPYGECPTSVELCPEVDCNVCRSSVAAAPDAPKRGCSLTNTEIIRCSKTDCIDYNTELCHPWKCTHAMKKHDHAIATAAVAAAREQWEKEHIIWMTPEEEEKRIRADAAKQERERVLDELEGYVNKNAPWLRGTDDRVTDARKLVAKIRQLRASIGGGGEQG